MLLNLDENEMNPSRSPFDLQTQKSAAKTSSRNAKDQDQDHPRQISDQFPMLESQGDAEFWPLSLNKPFFHVTISTIHLAKRFQLIIPHKLAEKLPIARVPATLICRGKMWDVEYVGDQVTRRFNNHSWGVFVVDNKLGIGDVCVFELMEGGSHGIKFRVQILRDRFPSELLVKAKGQNSNNPITID
ncbi:hypothetical protein OSB04_030093 [Centaurea solstitialis]|uniref:TF-B3 domain-containing protein n=1 Tax=Centaurea solstitialis TaxID=347529 RepID=A0AA38S6W7_9ASTR|nr:hypothetical protein OSB04_030093 [Centaurea solstitialis]